MEFCEYHLQGDIYFPSTAYERQLISCIWYVAGSFARPQQEQILPSGMAELIFNLSEPVSFNRNFDGRKDVLPRCFITGVSLNDVTLIKNKHQHFVGVQLRPFAIKALFGIPAYELTNSILDLTLLDKSLNAIWHRLGENTAFADRVALLREWICHRSCFTSPERGLDALGHFYATAHRNEKRIAQLAGDYCLSERSLRRKCNDWLGMSAEAFIRYRKYLQALTLLHSDELNLTTVGHMSGYYDQSHFIREFRSYTSMTPGTYREQKSIGIGHIYRDM